MEKSISIRGTGWKEWIIKEQKIFEHILEKYKEENKHEEMIDYSNKNKCNIFDIEEIVEEEEKEKYKKKEVVEKPEQNIEQKEMNGEQTIQKINMQKEQIQEEKNYKPNKYKQNNQ